MAVPRWAKDLGKRLRKPFAACVLLSFFVAGAVLSLRSMGWFQRTAMNVRDQFVRWSANPKSTDDRIVIVGMTEADLAKYGYPIDDINLATLLETIARQKP